MESSKGGILGKILLPGYTDAGPGTSFNPVQVGVVDDDVRSEAATEIHDNRTSAARSGKTQPAAQKQIPKSPKQSHPFFPSTKPTPTSPHPASPPPLFRRGVSTSSVVPETGALSREQLEKQPRMEYLNDKENPTKEVKLSEKALQAMESTNSANIAGGLTTNRQASMLDTEDDDTSYVSSTASEMGTVINVGSDRFAEIEAMAAMVEANPSVLEMPIEEESSSILLGEKSGLTLPILEANSFDEPTVLPQAKASANIDHGNNLGLKRKTTAADATTTTTATETFTTTPSINHQQFANNPATSAMVSAAIRRIGSGLTGKTRSAPPTPKTPGVPVPKVEDLLKSTLTPGRKQKEANNNGAPLSFALRSPGSSARKSVPKTAPQFSRTPPSVNHIEQRQVKAPVSPSLLLPGLNLARSCFSFDSTIRSPEDGAESDVLRELPTTTTRDRIRYRPLKNSKSWDVGNDSNNNAAFRSKTNVFGSFRKTASHDEQAQLRERINSDNFSPTKYSQTPAIRLQTPQRVDFEKQDALDILAVLVERGCEQQQRQSSDQNVTDSMVASLNEELDLLKKETEDNGGEKNYSISVDILEELLNSHAYALEMQRAALSASSWLKSIGRVSNPPDEDRKDSQLQRVDEKVDNNEVESRIDPNSDDTSLKMQVVTLKSMLNNAQLELKEKSEANEKLDLELSKCRAEIGRMKIASRSEPLHLTANKSIMDANVTDESAMSPEEKKKDEPSSTELDKDGDGEIKILDDSFNPDNSIYHADEPSEKVTAMRSALDQANDTIRQLYGELHKDKESEAPIVDIQDFVERSATSEANKETPNNTSISSELQTINVRMLDGENFVTEWTDLRPPLPPPPDHGLHSPIVDAVLEQWTEDKGLHESLIAWIENVMTGNNLESSVPPLTISSLDHQVRDGFVMHLLPQLLRRADIHIEVQTRAHRRTSYDLTVTVTQKTASFGGSHSNAGDENYVRPTRALLDQQDQHQIDEWAENFEPNLDAKSVAHSAVTEHINNSNTHYTGPYNDNINNEDPMARTGYSSFAGMLPPSRSGELDSVQQEQQQGTFMGALGGALGGLLSRRGSNQAGSSPSHGGQILQAASPIQEEPIEDEPYHRVVSAPPGRIGVTFVEFRGHAMISDVSPDSPLSGWVFPSDILIAIDELPVSGMRVRDIVKVLTARQESQRALRVISSHAMNEFTLNASALAEPTA